MDPLRRYLYMWFAFFLFETLISCEQSPRTSAPKPLSVLELEQLIGKNANRALFLSFWSGMSQSEYNQVSDYLVDKDRLTGFIEDKTYDFIIDGSKTVATLEPIFHTNNKLLAINLNFKDDIECFSETYLDQPYQNPNENCVHEYVVEGLQDLYKTKYGTPSRKSSVYEDSNPRQETFHLDYREGYKMIRLTISKGTSMRYKNFDEMMMNPFGGGEVVGYHYNYFLITYSTPSYFFNLDQSDIDSVNNRKKADQDKLDQQNEDL